MEITEFTDHRKNRNNRNHKEIRNHEYFLSQCGKWEGKFLLPPLPSHEIVAVTDHDKYTIIITNSISMTADYVIDLERLRIIIAYTRVMCYCLIYSC